MAEQANNMSPDKLVAGFSRTNIWVYLGIAVALHVVVIGFSSIGYFAEQLGFAQAAPAPQEAEEPADDSAEAPAVTETAATTTTPDTNKPVEGQPQNPDAPILDTLNDTANTDEIPRKPDSDLGLDIDMTN